MVGLTGKTGQLLVSSVTLPATQPEARVPTQNTPLDKRLCVDVSYPASTMPVVC